MWKNQPKYVASYGIGAYLYMFLQTNPPKPEPSHHIIPQHLLHPLTFNTFSQVNLNPTTVYLENAAKADYSNTQISRFYIWYFCMPTTHYCPRYR